MQKRREKQPQRQARREQKAQNPTATADDPMQDPSIDWGDAVREIKLDADGNPVEEKDEQEA